MNIRRFRLAAVVAAGLHGALFLAFSDGGRIPPAAAEPKVEPGAPPVRIDPAEFRSAEPSDSSPAGGGDPLPELPEVPAPLPESPVFAVSMERAAVDRRLVPDRGKIEVGPPGEGTGPDWSTPGGGGPIDWKLLDRAPRAKVQGAPVYPARLRHEGVEGEVTVRFDVDATGRVVRTEAVSWSHREFVEPALRAVAKWVFEPGRRDGKALAFRGVVSIEFGLGRD
ncbi:MAG: energy transducer TonB [Opitutaceae bacterium]|nr:energy transducer TonB [Opitutaceae bacterium]